jgi:hypothetical protein
MQRLTFHVHVHQIVLIRSASSNLKLIAAAHDDDYDDSSGLVSYFNENVFRRVGNVLYCPDCFSFFLVCVNIVS